MQKRIDLDKTTSDHKGLKGLLESSFRRFKVLGQLLTMAPLYLIACLVFGLALTPAIAIFRATQELVSTQSIWLQNLSYGFALAVGYFTYGTALMFVAAGVNFAFRTKLAPWRGPYHSIESIKWFIHNGLTYLVRFSFLEFVTPSPLAILFYRMMGMKIGEGTIINSTWISDPSLIELGDKVTIGGSVTMAAHYGQGGLLIIAPIKIGHGCTIGLKSSIMGGVTIGDKVKLLPHSVVLPKTVIPSGETWGGVPAQKIESKKSTDGTLKLAS